MQKKYIEIRLKILQYERLIKRVKLRQKKEKKTKNQRKK